MVDAAEEEVVMVAMVALVVVLVVLVVVVMHTPRNHLENRYHRSPTSSNHLRPSVH